MNRQERRALQTALERPPCIECGGAVVIPKKQSRPNQRFCSRACHQASIRRQRAESGYPICVVPGCERRDRSKGLCPMHRKRLKVHGSLDLPKPSTSERFWSRVDKTDPDGCWLWKGAPADSLTYGAFYLDDTTPISAHRWSYEAAFGPVPKGLFVLHHCDHRPCVRPDHLFVGTHTDNMRDMAAKGRSGSRGNPKLDSDQVAEMRRLHAAGNRRDALAVQFHVHLSTVDRIITRQTWRNVA